MPPDSASADADAAPVLVPAALLRWSGDASTRSKRLFEFVDERGRSVAAETYESFELRTRAVAARLVQAGLVGKRVLLVYPPGLEFIVAFVACLRARVVAVPVYPPRPMRSKDLSMFITVQRNCGATTALTSSVYNWAKRAADIKSAMTSWIPTTALSGEDAATETWPDLQWIVTDNISPGSASGAAGGVPRDAIDTAAPSDVAFLQYTSGSTSAPKGVVLTHANLAHNLALIIHSLKAGTDTVVVSWLPQYHDMGLIGSHLGSLYCGGQATIMSPLTFVKNPPLWLELASSRKATHLQAPNFAYRLTVRKFAQASPTPVLNLSSVRHVFNAAEPIDASAIDEFVKTFAPMGFNPQAMVPGYGLAEHTVYVCDGGEQRLVVDAKVLEESGSVVVVPAPAATPPPTPASPDQPRTRTLVGCGRPNRLPPAFDVRVRMVDPQSRTRLDVEDRVGEIWVSSPSKSNEYFGMAEKSQSDLRAVMVVAAAATTTEPGASVADAAQAETAPDDASREWLRTGDLGFFHDGELFVCGRIKDLLIVRGRNHFPQDIELSVERVDRERLRPGTSAAFAFYGGASAGGGEADECVGVVVEVRASVAAAAAQQPEVTEQLMVKIRAAVAKEHGVGLSAVVLLEEHSVPKTTSGKISRHRAKKAFEAGQLKEVARWVSGSVVEVVEDGGADDAAGDAAQPPIAVEKTTLRGEDLLQKLVEEAAALLERDKADVDVDAPLPELGLDSMALTQFKSAVFTNLGLDVPDEVLFDEATSLRAVLAALERREGEGSGVAGGAPGVDMGGERDTHPLVGANAHANAAGPVRPPRRRTRKDESILSICLKALCCRAFASS